LLAGVSFADANHGTAVGAFGTIVRTIDGGSSWVGETSGTDYDLAGVSFTDADNGTAVGYGGTILRTTSTTPTPTPTVPPTPTVTPIPTPTPGVITLTASGYRVHGFQTVDLAWRGATSTNVDIYRDGVVIGTVSNTGAYTDSIGVRGGNVRYTYKVCEAGTQTCSNEVTVRFGGPPL
jgi:hypothetical protein